MAEEIRRRTVLRLGTAAAGTGVVGSLAGCAQLDQSTDGGDDSNGEATETDDTDGEPSGPYRTWLPEPDALNEEHYFFNYVDYEQLRANESNFDPDVYDRYTEDEELLAQSDFSAADVDWVLSLTPVNDGDTPAVVTGSFSATAAANSLAEKGYEEDRDIGDFTVYSDPSRGEFAVRDGTVVLTSDPDSDYVRTLVETQNGEVTPYTEASDDMARQLDRFGSETFVGGTTSDPTTEDEATPSGLEFTGQVGFAYADAVEGETTTTEFVVLFETEDDIDMDAISESTGSDIFAEYSDVSSTQEGRMVIITGETPTDELYAN